MYKCEFELNVLDKKICVNCESVYCGKQCKVKEPDCPYFNQVIYENTLWEVC